MAYQASDPRRSRSVPRTTSPEIPTDTDMDTTNTDRDIAHASNSERSVGAVTKRMMNLRVNTDIPSPGLVEIPSPQLVATKDTELRSKIGMLQGPPDQVGPIMHLLYAVEALHQCVIHDPDAWPIAALDHAGLIDYCTRITMGPPQVRRAIQGMLPTSELVLDAVAFAEGRHQLDLYIQTITDPALKEAVESLANALRPPPPVPTG